MMPANCVPTRESLDGYQLLANAIVTDAARDYKRTLRAAKRGDDYFPSHLRSLKRFFRSSWYRMLTKVDAEYIMSRIEQEVEHEFEMEP